MIPTSIAMTEKFLIIFSLLNGMKKMSIEKKTKKKKKQFLRSRQEVENKAKNTLVCIWHSVPILTQKKSEYALEKTAASMRSILADW